MSITWTNLESTLASFQISTQRYEVTKQFSNLRSCACSQRWNWFGHFPTLRSSLYLHFANVRVSPSTPSCPKWHVHSLMCSFHQSSFVLSNWKRLKVLDGNQSSERLERGEYIFKGLKYSSGLSCALLQEGEHFYSQTAGANHFTRRVHHERPFGKNVSSWLFWSESVLFKISGALQLWLHKGFKRLW